LTFDMKRPILHGRPIIEFEPGTSKAPSSGIFARSYVDIVERRSRFGLLPRHATSDSVRLLLVLRFIQAHVLDLTPSQEIRWFSTGACYIFHVVNAWDEGDTVVLVACRAAFTSVLGILSCPYPTCCSRLMVSLAGLSLHELKACLSQISNT
jgi:hypothetical protein